MTAPRISFLYIDYILNEWSKQMKVNFGTSVERPSLRERQECYQYLDGGAYTKILAGLR
jgi:hypothetical protein